MLTVEQEYILLESMDKPWTMKEEPLYIVRDGVQLSVDHSDTHYGITDRKLYSVGEHGYVTTYHRDGAYEVHHYSYDLRSDATFAHAPPNPSFIATMFHVAKGMIDSGHRVRIVAPTGKSFEKYHRIALLLSKKHGYNVGVPSISKVPEHENKYSEMIIHNHPRNVTVGNAQMLNTLNEHYLKNYE